MFSFCDCFGWDEGVDDKVFKRGVKVIFFCFRGFVFLEFVWYFFYVGGRRENFKWGLVIDWL